MSDKLTYREAVEDIRKRIREIYPYTGWTGLHVGNEIEAILSRVSEEAPAKLGKECERDFYALSLSLEGDMLASGEDFYTIPELVKALARIRKALEDALIDAKELAALKAVHRSPGCTCCATSKCSPECGCWSQG